MKILKGLGIAILGILTIGALGQLVMATAALVAVLRKQVEGSLSYIMGQCVGSVILLAILIVLLRRLLVPPGK